MPDGRVITGFSKPYVAKYANNDGVISYTNGQPLARGVSVSIEPETGDASNFYANNVLAESAGGVFTGATATLTVDGMKKEARTLVMGLPAATVEEIDGVNVNIYEYDDRQVIPYVGIGFIVRWMSGGETTYEPHVFTKAIFDNDSIEAATQEEEIEFQTSELSANLLRDDSANHTWHRVAEEQTTEQAAENILRRMLGITTTIQEQR